MSKLLVIHNAKSGGGNMLKDIKQAFAEQQLDPEYVNIASSSLAAKVRTHLEKGSALVAAGGDGTINAVVTLMHGSRSRLGIIPMGTLNHFARELGIPLDISQAVGVIARGHHRAVDVGKVNDRLFVNNSSIGLYPRAVITRDNYKTRVGKWPAAVFGILWAMTHPRRYHIELRIKGKQQTLRTPFVFIGNNEYKRGQLEIGQRDALDKGVLAVYALKAGGLMHLPRLLLYTLFSRRRRTRDFVIYRVTACTISFRSRRTVAVACDGEVFRMKAPLHYQTTPLSLEVFTPRKTPAD